MRIREVAAELEKQLPPVDAPWDEDVDASWLQHHLAAVLVLLVPTAAGVSLLLTKRPQGLGRHGGQISLPGGRVESGDMSPWHAALRETWEEIGVPPGDVKALGMLRPLQLAVSDNLVLPFVGWTDAVPDISLQPAEVEELLEMPLDLLLDPDSVEEEVWPLRGDSLYSVTYYRLGRDAVWGATARILADLAGRLGAPERRWPPGSVRAAR
jgi:8-oxo-dGTP pyrophosphatase MutT (NUDIX family)